MKSAVLIMVAVLQQTLVTLYTTHYKLTANWLSKCLLIMSETAE